MLSLMSKRGSRNLNGELVRNIQKFYPDVIPTEEGQAEHSSIIVYRALNGIYDKVFSPSYHLKQFLKEYLTDSNEWDMSSLKKKFSDPFASVIHEKNKRRLELEIIIRNLELSQQKYRDLISPRQDSQDCLDDAGLLASSPRLSQRTPRTPRLERAHSDSTTRISRSRASSAGARDGSSALKTLSFVPNIEPTFSLPDFERQFSARTRQVVREITDSETPLRDETILTLKESGLTAMLTRDQEYFKDLKSRFADLDMSQNVQLFLMQQIRWLAQTLNLVSKMIDTPESEAVVDLNNVIRVLDKNYQVLVFNIREEFSSMDAYITVLNTKLKNFESDFQALTDFNAFYLWYDFQKAENNRSPLGMLASQFVESIVSHAKIEASDPKSTILLNILGIIEILNNYRRAYRNMNYIEELATLKVNLNTKVSLMATEPTDASALLSMASQNQLSDFDLGILTRYECFVLTSKKLRHELKCSTSAMRSLVNLISQKIKTQCQEHFTELDTALLAFKGQWQECVKLCPNTLYAEYEIEEDSSIVVQKEF